jgi:hypothetical protein
MDLDCCPSSGENVNNIVNLGYNNVGRSTSNYCHVQIIGISKGSIEKVALYLLRTSGENTT